MNDTRTYNKLGALIRAYGDARVAVSWAGSQRLEDANIARLKLKLARAEMNSHIRAMHDFDQQVQKERT